MKRKKKKNSWQNSEGNIQVQSQENPPLYNPSSNSQCIHSPIHSVQFLMIRGESRKYHTSDFLNLGDLCFGSCQCTLAQSGVQQLPLLRPSLHHTVDSSDKTDWKKGMKKETIEKTQRKKKELKKKRRKKYREKKNWKEMEKNKVLSWSPLVLPVWEVVLKNTAC